MLVCIIQIGFLSLWTKTPKAVELEAQNQNLLMQIQRVKSLVIFAAGGKIEKPHNPNYL